MTQNKNKRRGLSILVAAGALLVMPGCLQDAPEVPFTPLSALNGLDAAQDTVQDNVETPQLAYVQGYEHKVSLESAVPNDGYLEEWEIGYFFPLTQQWRIVKVSWDGATETFDLPAHPEAGMTFQPIDPLLAIDSPEAMVIAAADLKEKVPAFDTGDQLNYFLSHRDGTDVWQLVFRGHNATVVSVDAHTGEVLDPAGPEPRSFLDALDLAHGTLTEDEADALLLSAGAREVEDGGATSVTTGNDEELFDGVFLPPDVTLGDGKSLVWVFVYHDPSTAQTWPVWVYAGLLPIRGDDLPKPAPYSTDVVLGISHYIDLPVLDSTYMVDTYVPGESRTPASYLLGAGYVDGAEFDPDTWEFQPDTGGDVIFGLFVNAQDGSCISPDWYCAS